MTLARTQVTDDPLIIHFVPPASQNRTVRERRHMARAETPEALQGEEVPAWDREETNLKGDLTCTFKTL